MSAVPIADERRRVILVEDEAMSRSLLCDVLTGAGFEVEPCASATEALQAFKGFDPDALVTDIDLGQGPSGLDLVVAMAKMAPYLAVVILSNYSITPDYRHDTLGRAAYLRKQELTDSSILVGALEGVLHDQPEGDRSADGVQARLAALTSSQVQVLRMIAEGLSNEEIARRRATSVKSVEHMVTRIIMALGLKPDPAVNMRVSAARVYIEEAGLPALGPS
jgi:DNA-binding NarL/FixJ family response regulator